MRALIAAVFAALCVAGASIARSNDGSGPSPMPSPTSEIIVAAVDAAQKAAHLPGGIDRCPSDPLEAQRS